MRRGRKVSEREREKKKDFLEMEKHDTCDSTTPMNRRRLER